MCVNLIYLIGRPVTPLLLAAAAAQFGSKSRYPNSVQEPAPYPQESYLLLNQVCITDACRELRSARLYERDLDHRSGRWGRLTARGKNYSSAHHYPPPSYTCQPKIPKTEGPPQLAPQRSTTAESMPSRLRRCRAKKTGTSSTRRAVRLEYSGAHLISIYIGARAV